MNNGLSRGSEWHRWDPHLHAPGTLFQDKFKGDWDAYCAAVDQASPPIEALGVTDYFGISGYVDALSHKQQGKLKSVAFLFPNVELRLDLKTASDQAVNIHLLFSPLDEDHAEQIERLLGELSFEYNDTKYRCGRRSLAALGRAFSGSAIPDEKEAARVGANQFKASVNEIRLLLKDPWARKNCLVGVSGSNNDGTAGLQKDDSFKAIRIEIERMADVIFSSTPGQRTFWLGQGVASRHTIESTYGAVKPCLHGSDAHQVSQVGMVTDRRYCWVKGNLTFETLRQAAIEPEERTWIGESPPQYAMAPFSIAEILPSGTAWLKHVSIPLNTGLVAIIGARGSGKTALVDIVAAGTHSIVRSLPDSSFLAKASHPINLLIDASVDLVWADQQRSSHALNPNEWRNGDIDAPLAKYLSQQFVDRLCSSSGLAHDLRKEIERVVFEAIEPAERLETVNFAELSSIVVQPILERQARLREAIASVSTRIAQEDIAKRTLPSLKKQASDLREQIAKLNLSLSNLLPKHLEQNAKLLSDTNDAWNIVSAKVESVALRRQKLTDLRAHVKSVRDVSEPESRRLLIQTYGQAALDPSDWSAFKMVFAGDVDSIVNAAANATDEVLSKLKDGVTQDVESKPLSDLSLRELATKLSAAQAGVGLDAANQLKYQELLKRIGVEESRLRRLDAAIESANGAEARRLELIQQRRANYASVFDELAAQEVALRQLYQPLTNELKNAEGALAKLKVVVMRRPDPSAWAEAGQAFIDLRTASKLRGKGKLLEETELKLLGPWMKGSSSDVASAMETFRDEFQDDFTSAIPKSLSLEERSARIQEIAAWLYDTHHVTVSYGIEFDGVSIENLSPGTRGIVLLLLYLAIDKRDQRPLIVDQPEENLDPQSIYRELVPHFREARKRRQILLVTHNANLVVNTDADQIIVARAERTTPDGLPDISYQSGGLEDESIRNAVCNILEGGSRAFLERERRYRIGRASGLEEIR